MSDLLIHTMGERDRAYQERNRIVAALSKLFPSYWYADPKATGWPVIAVMLPTGQATWHVPSSDFNRWFTHLKERLCDWDGHDTEEKYQRLDALPVKES